MYYEQREHNDQHEQTERQEILDRHEQHEQQEWVVHYEGLPVLFNLMMDEVFQEIICLSIVEEM